VFSAFEELAPDSKPDFALGADQVNCTHRHQNRPFTSANVWSTRFLRERNNQKSQSELPRRGCTLPVLPIVPAWRTIAPIKKVHARSNESTKGSCEGKRQVRRGRESLILLRKPEAEQCKVAPQKKPRKKTKADDKMA